MGNLEDLLRLVLMRNVGVLKQSLMVESLLETLPKRRSQMFYKPVDMHSVTNAISIWNIVNQLGKYDISYGLGVNNLKEKQLFSDQMNRNRFDLILAWRYWNSFSIDNLRCLNSAVNEII